VKKFLIGAAVAAIPITATALWTNILSIPFEYVKSKFTRTETIGAELHVQMPANFPPIRELNVTRTASGANFELK
jgi:hypothetical protein